MTQLVFASGNEHKFAETKDILRDLGVSIQFRKCELKELQTTNVTDLIRQKCLDAYSMVGRTLFVEHTTLHNLHYGGFPGGLTSPFLSTVGLKGAAELLGQPGRNAATATTTIAFTDGRTIQVVKGEMTGTICDTPEVAVSEWEKFGWNSIFVPDGYTNTLASLGMTEKNKISMRRAALTELAKSIR